MALNLEDKKQIVADISSVASSAHSIIAADYRGLDVAKMTDLHLRAREQGVYLRVVRNTLARRALGETQYECVCEELTGPMILAFSQEDLTSAAKLFNDFMAEHESVKVKVFAVGGDMLDVSAVKRLANLPSKEESIAQLMGVMKAPVSQLVSVLSAVSVKLVRTLAAVQQKKQAETTT